jgi:hypothetical protein
VSPDENEVTSLNTIAVFENSGERFAEAVAGAFTGASGDVAVNPCGRQGSAGRDNIVRDIIIVSPGYSGVLRGKCRALLAPDECAAAAFSAQNVITYGFSPRATLTLSAAGAESGWLAVQRELVTLSGVTVEEQELEIPMLSGADASLAAAGGRLLLGLTGDSGS